MLEDDVDIFIIFRTDSLLQADYIIMLQLPQEHDLSICSLRIC